MHIDGFSAPYQRYLVNYLRDGLPFAQAPIRLLFRKWQSSDTKDEIAGKRKAVSRLLFFTAFRLQSQ